MSADDFTAKERAQWGKGLALLQSMAPKGVFAQGNAFVRNGVYPSVAANARGVEEGALMFQTDAPKVMLLVVGSEVSTGISFNRPAETLATGDGVRIRVQYGAGPASNVVDMDLRSGTYQLPACQFVRAGLAAYGSVADANLQMALIEGSSVNVDVPSYTSMLVSGVVPNAARAVELPTPGRLAIGGVGGQAVESDWLAAVPVYAPPYSPVRIDCAPGNGYVLTPAATFTGVSRVRWLLSL